MNNLSWGGWIMKGLISFREQVQSPFLGRMKKGANRACSTRPHSRDVFLLLRAFLRKSATRATRGLEILYCRAVCRDLHPGFIRYSLSNYDDNHKKPIGLMIKTTTLTSTTRLRRETNQFDILCRTWTYDDEFSRQHLTY